MTPQAQKCFMSCVAGLLGGSTDLSTCAFFFGTFPIAPTLAVYGLRYSTAERDQCSLTSTATVLSTMVRPSPTKQHGAFLTDHNQTKLIVIVFFGIFPIVPTLAVYGLRYSTPERDQCSLTSTATVVRLSTSQEGSWCVPPPLSEPPLCVSYLYRHRTQHHGKALTSQALWSVLSLPWPTRF
jgi:uncharacterized membrane protein YjjB (DUF3815 family)